MNDPNYKGKQDILKNELINTGMVSDMALSSSPLTAVWNNMGGFTWQGKDPEKESDFSITNVSHDFGKIVGWNFVAGRNFSTAFSTDSGGVIINETAAKYLGLKNPVGQFINNEDFTMKRQILGVIKDVITGSPYEPVKRAFFFLDYNYAAAAQIVIKIKPTVSAGEALPKIEEVFKKIVPSASFRL